jgi:glutamate-1-semialdehyde aminotransferase
MKVDRAMVQGYPSMFQVLFTKQDRVDNYRDFTKSNNELFTKMQKPILTKGIMLDKNNGEQIYTSAAHNNNDLMHTLEAFEASLPFRAHEKPHNR